jgi:alpha-D-ribose 1-methylphosphonate 5-triphosphate synthase subunit PhnH
MTTQLSGLQETVNETQTTFSTLLSALAQPGRMYEIVTSVRSPIGMTSALAAACLTLLEQDTVVWLQPNFPKEIQSWLSLHIGCRFTTHLPNANFALIWDAEQLSDLVLPGHRLGTIKSAVPPITLLIQIESMVRGEPIFLKGAGIMGNYSIFPELPSCFWDQWQVNSTNHSLGVDIFLFTETDVVAIPRTIYVESFASHERF